MTEQKVNFEQSLQQLEQIVNQIERGEVSLEESIEKYAHGVELIKKCRAILNQAEKKITLLAQNEEGQLDADGELEELDESEEI